MITNQTGQSNPINEEIYPLALEALDNSPIYVEHIYNQLSSAVENLQQGNDQAGLNAFARSTTDLDQFIQLFEQMVALAKPSPCVATNMFREDMMNSIYGLEQAMIAQDLVALSDNIATNLMPILPRWTEVEGELRNGLAAQHA